MLKASTFSRASTPTQSPSGALSRAGIAASVPASTLASRPFSSSSTSSGEFSVKSTSAGDASPSVAIWLAISGASPLWILTGMPVALVKAAAIMSVICWCWAL